MIVRLREAVRLLGVALGFLTRLPVPSRPLREGDLRRAAGAFPLVGLVVAGAGVAVRTAAGTVWDPVVATLVAVAAMVLVTGAFHEDGLADTADGLWGGWTPQRRREVMHDPRLGTYGVVALIGSLGLRVALLAPLATGAFARAVVAGHVLGRASTLLAVRVASPLPDSSAGQLASGLPLSGVVLAAGTAVGAVVWASGVWGIPVLVVAGVLASAGARLCHHRFGGLGGDSLGAVNQVVHLAVLSAVAAVVA